MSNLMVHFGGGNLLTGIPVSCELINDRLEVVDRLSMQQGVVREFQVTPGDYLVRAQLPSGEIISQHASVSVDQMTTVELTPTPSPHEWLAWQSAFGVLQSRAVSDSMESDAPSGERHYHLPTQLHEQGGTDIPEFTRSLQRRSSRPSSLPRERAMSEFASVWLRIWRYDGRNWSVIPCRPLGTLGEEKFVKVELPSSSTVSFIQVGGPSVPWRFMALPPAQEHIDILLQPTDQGGELDAGLDVNIVSRSPAAEALLRYMVTGALESARAVAGEVVEQAESLLRNKMFDPMGAAIGGYYLLRAGTIERMHDWPANFANYINWLPDSAVIHAWQLLRGDNAADTDVAGNRLLEAARRGVPIYTQGLRLLLDGLSLFSDESQAQKVDRAAVRGALRQLRPYATAANWSEALTTFYGQKPESPSLEPVTGTPDEDNANLFRLNQVPGILAG